MSVSTNWPFEKMSRYLMCRILESYCSDPRRVHKALQILDGDQDDTDDFEELAPELQPAPVLDGQDAMEPPVDIAVGEWPCYAVGSPWELPEPFEPTPEDWQDYVQWSDRIKTMRALGEARQIAEWHDRLEQVHMVTDEDLMAAGLPVG